MVSGFNTIRPGEMKKLIWQTEKIYYQHQNYFDDLVFSIQLAQVSIELETYIFDCDRIGQLILEELKLASRRGVEVRLVVDGLGAFFEISKIYSILSGSSVKFKVFHPLLFPQTTKLKWLRFDLILKAAFHLNRRLHRKICLIDKQILYLGSFNITDNSNRETGARVTGRTVLNMFNVFEIVWDRADHFKLSSSNWRFSLINMSLLRLNYSRKLRKTNRIDLCRRMACAKSRILITNAYFVPPQMILKAIFQARVKGVTVEIFVPSYSKPRFMKLLTEMYYRRLLTIGVKIYEYQNDFLHAKSLLIDKWAIVGSSNMNYRSFFHDLEVDVVLNHTESVLSLENQFEIDRHHSKQINLDSLVKHTWLDRIFTWFLSFIRDSL